MNVFFYDAAILQKKIPPKIMGHLQVRITKQSDDGVIKHLNDHNWGEITADSKAFFRS